MESKGGLPIFWQLFRFWILKWVLKWYLPLSKKNIKHHFQKLLVETIACQTSCQTKNDEEICAPKKIHQHEANQKNSAQVRATLQRPLRNTPQHFSVGGGHRWSCHFLRIQVFACNLCFLSCRTIKVHPARTQMPSECPPSHPLSNEFSFGLVPFPVRLFVSFYPDMSNQLKFQ